MEPPKLLDLSIKALVDNIDNYDKNLVKTIIGPVRQKMLKNMLDMVRNHGLKCDGQDNHVQKMWATLPVLINSKIYTKFDTHDILCLNCSASSTVTNSRFQEFIRCLGANTPNLRELTIDRPTTTEEYSLGERELDSIIQLKNLTSLTIFQVDVPLSGILTISRRCEKLDHIHAFRVLIDVELSCAAFGDDFSYVYIDARKFYRGQVVLRMQRTMPTSDPKYIDDTPYIHLKLWPKTNQELFHLAHAFAEKLKKIEIHFGNLEDIEEMVEFPQLPHLKYAEIGCDDGSAHASRCFLRRNGESLQKLTLFDVDIKDNMTFSEIFSLCPNLQYLKLYRCTLVGNDAPVGAMQQLKRFKWRSSHRYTARQGFASEEVAFSSVLLAPLLEELDIELAKINFSDNATIIAQIQRREILRNLKKIDMDERMIRIPSENDYSSYLARFTEFKKALESLKSAGP